MLGSAFISFLLCPLLAASSDVRLLDAAGSFSNVGLLQVRMDNDFGTVCGANAAAADVICKSMGYKHGSISTSPCGFYGGSDLCAAAGSPVAMSDLKCEGSEWSVGECSWGVPDDACMAHSSDVVVYCSKSERTGAPEGAVRLIAADGSPSIDGKGRPEIFYGSSWVPVCSSGLSPGAATVICKSMGFTGASGSSKCSGQACGSAPPGISELACSGTESAPLACPHEAGDSVFCAAAESAVVTCAGDGETQGRPAKEVVPQLSV